MLSFTVERSTANFGGKHKFTAVAAAPITSEMAKHAQNKDYPVSGYDFLDFHCERQEDGLYRAEWYCYESCE